MGLYNSWLNLPTIEQSHLVTCITCLVSLHSVSVCGADVDTTVLVGMGRERDGERDGAYGKTTGDFKMLPSKEASLNPFEADES